MIWMINMVELKRGYLDLCCTVEIHRYCEEIDAGWKSLLHKKIYLKQYGVHMVFLYRGIDLRSSCKNLCLFAVE